MSEHLNRDRIRDWLEHRLDVSALTEVAEHLKSCAGCRELAAEAQRDRLEAAASAVGALAVSAGSAEHPDQEELCRYVDGELDSVDREIVEAHLEGCSGCARELGEIRNFRAILTTYELSTAAATAERPAGRFAWLRRPLVWAPLQSAAVAVLVAALFWNGLGGRLNEVRQAADRAESEQLALRSRLEAREAELAEVRARERELHELATLRQQERDEARRRLAQAAHESVIRSGEAELIRRPDGRWERRAPVEAPFQVALAGPIELPDDLPPRVTGRGVLRGGDEAGVEAAGPNGVVAVTLRPEFTWKPVEGASGYRLGLYREDFSAVEEVSGIASPRWMPTRELQPGTAYRWQVTALAGDGSDIAASAEIRFRTAPAPTLDAIRRMEADPDVTDAERAILYARAGALDRAQPLLTKLAADNPGNPWVRDWLERVERALAGRRSGR